MPLTPLQKKGLIWVYKEPKDRDDLCIMMGNVRGGKTWGSCLMLLTHSLARKNKNYIIAGKTLGAVTRNVKPKLREITLSMGLDYVEVERGSAWKIGDNVFWFFGANDEKAQDVVQGMDASGYLLDEVVLLPKSFREQCDARCSDYGAIRLQTLNASHPEHEYVKNVYNNPEIPSFKIEAFMQDVENIGALPEGTRAKYENRFTGARKLRWLYNQFASETGAILSHLKTDNTMRQLMPYEYKRVVCGVDWGQDHPTAGIFLGEIERGIWQTCGEYYYDKGELLPHEHAKALKILGDQLGCKKYVVDTSAASMKKALRKEGVRVVGARREPIARAIHANECLLQKKVLITNSVPKLLEEAASYNWVEGKKKDTLPEINDDACDAFGYVVMDIIQPNDIDLTPIDKPKGL